VKTQHFCFWCGRGFRPRVTGGRPQRFCSPSHRDTFFSAARAWALKLVEVGLLTPETLRATTANLQVAGGTIQEGPAPAGAGPGGSE
jgi:hypothetical protein